MKKYLFSLLFLSLLSFASHAITINFNGGQYKVLQYDVSPSSGLNKVYVAYDTSLINEMIISGLSGNVRISKYDNRGGAFAEDINFSYDGSNAIVDNPEGDRGYIIEDGSSIYYMWLVDYLPHKFNITSLIPSDTKDCNYTYLDAVGSGGAINFITINGRQEELSREIRLDYENLVWNESAEIYEKTQEIKILDHLSSIITVNPPLYCNSDFRITGDRFLEAWGIGLSLTSEMAVATGVDAHTSAVQTNINEEDASNVIRTETSGMGGSAPVEVEFKAYITDAVIHNEWQIASDESFEYDVIKIYDQNFDYTFNDEGNYYIRYVGSNSDGSCEVTGDTYTVSVGASELKIPNAFTPNGDGINDEWKVSYRSLLSFSCSIFDRYGTELFHFTDPTQGWDGKYKGKYVQPGVYFYVIEAVGADGKKYKKGGDINIIKAKKYSNTGSGYTE